MRTDSRTVGGRVEYLFPLFDFLFVMFTLPIRTSILIPIFPAFLLLYSSLFFSRCNFSSYILFRKSLS